MTARKTTTAGKDTVEIVRNDVDDTTTTAPKGVIKDGIYTEEGVELINGAKIDVSVIVDRDLLPATYGSLLAEGNGPALVIATLTTQTRRVLDLTGATMKDIEFSLSPVVRRGQDAAGDAE